MTATRYRSGVVGVGYEGRQADEFIQGLVAAGVDVVVDVRLTPVSRKRGFSKRMLAEQLEAAGIRYEHLRALGNPKDNRAGFAGTHDDHQVATSRYASLLTDHDDALDALHHVTELAMTHRVALLCFEATDHRCHRQVVLHHVAAQLAVSKGD